MSALHPKDLDELHQVGRYELIEVLGRGGQGVVYRAHDPNLGADVAVKILLDDGHQVRQRFLNEARLMRQLDDPGVVTVHDVDVHRWSERERDLPYFVMEYCERGTLGDRLRHRGRPLTVTEGVALARMMAACTRSLGVPRPGHPNGIVHRDLKPSNYLIRVVATADQEPVPGLLEMDEQLIVGDLGIAKSVNPEATNLTLVGGTPAWGAPEQFRTFAFQEDATGPPPSAVDVRADIYAASRIVTAAVTGVVPESAADFTAEELAATGSLEAELRRGMSGDRDRRHADFGAWRDALVAATAPSVPVDETARSPTRVTMAALGLLAVVSLATLLWLASTGRDDSVAGEGGFETVDPSAPGEEIGPVTTATIVAPSDAPEESVVVPLVVPTFAPCPGRTFNLSGNVHQIEYHPDGKLLAVTNIDNAVFIVDSEDGSVQRTLLGHTAGVVGAAFNSDGSVLATAASDDTARVWDLAGDQPELVITHVGTDPEARPLMFRTAIDPNDEMLLTTNDDGTAQLWGLPDGRFVRSFEEHRGGVVAAAFNDDGTLAATGDAAGTVILWDPRTGASGLRLTEHGSAVYSAQFSSDGALLATASADGRAIIWDPSNGEIKQVLDDGTPGQSWSVSFNRDGTVLAVAAEGEVQLWNTATGENTQRLPGFLGDVYDVAFSPDGTELALVDPSGSLAIYCAG